MRFAEYLIEPMQTVLIRRATEIDGFLQFFAGGWEAWLQVELAMELWQRSDRNQSFQAQREVPYPVGKYRWDLQIMAPKGASYFVELKTQRSNLDPTSFSRFLDDVTKVNALSSDFRKKNVTGVLAVTKLASIGEHGKYVEFMRMHPFNVNLGSGTRVWQRSGDKWLERRTPEELEESKMTLVCWTPVS